MTIAQDANAIFAELTEDIGIEIPEIDISGEDFEFPFGKDSDSALYKEVQPLDLCALTDGTVDGNGAFDKVMQGIKAHLLEEFKGNRITGGEYTKAYIAMVEAGLANGVAFLLGKDRAFWEAQRAQIDAFRARVELETSKAQLALVSFQAKTAEAQYALAKMQALGASVEVETGKYRLDNMLPVEKDLLDGQKELQVLQIEGQNYTNQQLIYTVENLLPQQLLLLIEQTQVQRAQTLDTRADGSTVVGLLGKQKALYSQQIISYERDVELKFMKNYLDAWITQKTVDDGLAPPNQFTNTFIDSIFAAGRIKVGL